MSEDLSQLIECYRRMILIRRFEEKVDELFAAGELRGTSHLSVGQEACAVGAVVALCPEDLVTSNHRGHGHFLAKGGDPKRIMAELFGKEPGYSRGWGGTQHMACFKIGFLGSNGITGGGIPIATGAALSCKLHRNGRVVLCFLGEGATNQGTFHESLNMAAIWRLPVIYLCENNLYAMSTRITDACLVENLADRAAAYGLPGQTIEGNDFFAVREAVATAAHRARSGEGPTLLEAKTYRQLGHSRGDLRIYRSRDEEQTWKHRDPIPRLGQRLIELGALTDAQDALICEQAARLVDDAVLFARSAPLAPTEELTSGKRCSP